MSQSYVRHRSKQLPLVTLCRYNLDTRYCVKHEELKPVPIQKIVSRANGKVSYRIYDMISRQCDAYSNFWIQENYQKNHGYASMDAVPSKWTARYMVTKTVSNNTCISVYQKLSSRAIVHVQQYYDAHIVYQLDRLPLAPLVKNWTGIFYVNISKRYQINADKHWFMPLRTIWIIPEGESKLNYLDIGIYHLRQVIHDPDIVDITYDYIAGIMWFKSSKSTEVTIVRDHRSASNS